MEIMLKNTTRTWYLIIPKKADNAAKNEKPLINLDVNNPDFKAGVMALANLQIQRHDDYLVMLKAICILVQERLTHMQLLKQIK